MDRIIGILLLTPWKWGTLCCLLLLPPLGGKGLSRILASPLSAGQTASFVLPGGAQLDMVLVPAGALALGSPAAEPGRYPDEGPQHQVAIEHNFYLGKFELTQGQWESVMKTRPWAGKEYVQDHPDHPAVYISFADVQAFIAQLNAAEGLAVYRLPTEAEWEYACRAGTTTLWSFGEDESRLKDYAWYKGNIEERFARATGMKEPNPWGLCDMHGNVWEWVLDPYVPYTSSSPPDPIASEGTDRVNRGGSFHDEARRLRSAYRNHDHPGYRSADLGLRLLRQVQ